jgi:predicted ATPase
MRATLDWSYGLLTDAQQTVLCLLSIFSGDFSLRTAGAVCRKDQLLVQRRTAILPVQLP